MANRPWDGWRYTQWREDRSRSCQPLCLGSQAWTPPQAPSRSPLHRGCPAPNPSGNAPPLSPEEEVLPNHEDHNSNSITETRIRVRVQLQTLEGLTLGKLLTTSSTRSTTSSRVRWSSPWPDIARIELSHEGSTGWPCDRTGSRMCRRIAGLNDAAISLSLSRRWEV